jgi:hypothetical protein
MDNMTSLYPSFKDRLTFGLGWVRRSHVIRPKNSVLIVDKKDG